MLCLLLFSIYHKTRRGFLFIVGSCHILERWCLHFQSFNSSRRNKLSSTISSPPHWFHSDLVVSQMGLSRFLSFLPKPSKRLHSNPFLLFLNIPATQTVLTRSLTSDSFSTLKDQTLLQNSKPHIETQRGSLPKYCLGFHRPFHDGAGQVFDEINDKDPDVILSNRVHEDAEKVCKLLTKGSNSSIEAVLDGAKVEVSPELVVEVLKKLSNAGSLALSFFQWAENKQGFKYSNESYNALIEALGKIKQFKVVWNLVSDMKRKGLLSKETFALISRRYARARKVKEAVDAFEKIEKFGMKLEVPDYNRLIDTLSKSRNVEKAQEVFDTMKKRRFVPDIKSYTILLEGWGQEQNLLRLNEVYREMRDEGFEPDVVTYGIIINAHCKARKYDEALELFREMEAKNCKPSPHIFCTLINGLGSERRLSEALEFFELSKAYGFVPEAPTYNALVGAYCWSMRMYDVHRVVDEMRKCGVGPNSRTYDIILHHLIKARRTQEAYSVFQRMSNDPGCEPTVSTYEIIVRMFCNVERVDMAIRVWDQMKTRGVLPGMHMFSTLINSLSHENKLDDACKYFQEMLDKGIRPPAQMFSKLKQALLDEGREDTALILAQKIDKLRKAPLVR